MTRAAFLMIGLLLPATARAASQDGPQAHTESQRVVLPAPAPSPTGFRTLFRDLGGDVRHLPSQDSALIASIGAGLALAVHPFDDNVNQKLAEDGRFFRAGDVAGNTLTLMGASTALYTFGRAFDHDKAAHVGLDLLRAQIMTEAIVQSLKFSVERPRPDASPGYSFPSGHAAVTFATAAVLDRHHSWRIALPAYAFATYVATSRLHDNVHNLSDVVVGAAVGTIAGRAVTRHVVPHFSVMPQAVRGGAAMMFVATPKPS